MFQLPLGWVDVNVDSIGTTEVEPLSQKRLDAAMTFLPNEAAQMTSLGYDVETLTASDALADPDAAFNASVARLPGRSTR